MFFSSVHQELAGVTPSRWTTESHGDTTELNKHVRGP